MTPKRAVAQPNLSEIDVALTNQHFGGATVAQTTFQEPALSRRRVCGSNLPVAFRFASTSGSVHAGLTSRLRRPLISDRYLFLVVNAQGQQSPRKEPQTLRSARRAPFKTKCALYWLARSGPKGDDSAYILQTNIQAGIQAKSDAAC